MGPSSPMVSTFPFPRIGTIPTNPQDIPGSVSNVASNVGANPNYYFAGPYCFGMDIQLCKFLGGTDKNGNIDISSTKFLVCWAISNAICLMVGVGVLTVILALTVNAFLQE